MKIGESEYIAEAEAMKAAIYIRVSTDEQAANGLSVENQVAKCRGYCELYELTPYEVITDAGKSGKDLRRPGIRKVIELCEAGEVEDVVVYDLSRLTRSTKDLLHLIEDVFDDNGIHFHSIRENLDTRTPAGKLVLTILGAVNQMAREEISVKTRDALQHKIEQGGKVGRAPFGCRYVEGALVEDPEQTRIVRRIVRNYKYEGVGLSDIARRLNKRKVESQTGKPWTPQMVQGIVRTNG